MRTRYFVLASPGTWTELRKQAIELHVSLTRLVQYLGTIAWERTGVGDHPTMPWLRVGQRARPLGLALHRETLDEYAEIARAMFIVSASGSREWVGAVLQMYVEGRIVPVGKLAPTMKGVTARRQNIHLSKTALVNLQAKVRPARQLSRGLHQMAERKNNFILSAKPSMPGGRRFPVAFRLDPRDIEFFAKRAMELDLRPAYAQGLISWASRFLEDFGLGRIVEVPLSAHHAHPSDHDLVVVSSNGSRVESPVHAG